ncbi:MAG: hypothetical protein E7389_00255 [Ruminococcaceae bacterium]|nr:hypothetical protein [Oscillospiraceae bacterium]
MKTKKILSKILAFAMVLSCLVAMTAVESSAAGFSLPSNYHFVDIAHKPGTSIYVASARDDKNSAPLFYYSNDGGLSWQEPDSQPLSSTAEISSSRKTQQQLEWWEGQNVFVIHGTGVPGVYTSTDGVSWTGRQNLQWGGNNVISITDGKLVFAGESKVEVAENVNTALRGSSLTPGYKFTPEGSNIFYTNVTASATKDNVIYVYAATQWTSYYIALTPAENGYTSEVRATRYNQYGTSPYDAVYAKNADRFLGIDGEEANGNGNGTILASAPDGSAQLSITVAEDKKVTGIGVNDSYIVAGMNDGSVYYTANDTLTENTVWTQVPCESTVNEPIKNIALEGDYFVALGTSKIFTGKLGTVYSDIDDYVSLNTPEIVGGNPFDGIRLIGGAFNGKEYVVYGNDVSTNHGKVFFSDDIINWTMVYEGTAKFEENMRNGAVWFEKDKKFIISASTLQTSGASVTGTLGEEGYNWEWEENNGKGYALRAEIAVGGDGNIYSPNNREKTDAKINKYTAWSESGKSEIDLSEISGVSDYMSHIAVSDDDEPAIFVYGQAAGLVKNSGAEGTWTSNSAYHGVGAQYFIIDDAVYVKALQSFIAVSHNPQTNNKTTTVISKTGTVVRGPRLSGNSVAEDIANAVDANDDVVMFACNKGLYSVSVNANVFNGNTDDKLVEVHPANGTEKNTLPVINVFKAGSDAFVAVTTDGTNSDLLLAAKDGGSYIYTKASGNKVENIEALDGARSFNVSVSGINNRSSEYSFVLITAVYEAGENTNKLKEYYINNMSLPTGSGSVKAAVSLDHAINENSVIKVFTFDSIGGLKPLTAETNPF